MGIDTYLLLYAHIYIQTKVALLFLEWGELVGRRCFKISDDFTRLLTLGRANLLSTSIFTYAAERSHIALILRQWEYKFSVSDNL